MPPKQALADLLAARKEEILRRWSEAVERSLAPSRYSRREIVDHVPDFLGEMVVALRREDGSPAPSPIAGESTNGRKHGGQRFRLGFELEAMVREYGVLADVVLALVETGSAAVSVAELRRFQALVSDAVAEASAEYEREALRRDRELANERDKLEAIFRQSPAAMALWRGADLVFERVNPDYQAIFPGRELVGKPLREALPELVGQPFPALLTEVFATGRPWVGHETLTRLATGPGGALQDHYYDVTYVRVDDAAGRPYGVYDHAIDVTERVLARRRLEASDEALRLALAGGQMGTWSVRLPAGELTCDATFRALHHTRDGEGLDAAIDAHTHPDDRARIRAALAESLRSRSPYACEYRVLAGDGAARWVYARGEPKYDADGAARSIAGVAFDVDAERSLENEREGLLADTRAALDEARAARETAERATRAMDEFLATVSHELRTPLSAMLGWARLLAGGQVPEAQRPKAIATIERNAVAQAQLIEDLLDVTRITAGKLRLEIGPVDLVRAIEAAVDVVTPAADARGVRLSRSLNPAAGAVTGDAARLQQVVWNLLANAVKFTPRGGEVTVRLARSGAFTEVAVSDTGQGIEPALLERVFERFKQADGSTTRSHGGLGLGLSIVRSLVELHGGSVHAKSDGRGRGATFTVCLPLAPARAGPATPSSLPPPRSVPPPAFVRPLDLRGLRMVVVDDEADARELLVAILEPCGATIAAFGSAAEAFEAIGREVPALVVSDVGMPGEDGYSFARRIRALSPERGGRVPLIALTAYARVEDRARARDEGFDRHVAKPIEPAALFEAITAVLPGVTGAKG